MSNFNIQNGPNFLLPAYSTQNRSSKIRNSNNTNIDSTLLWDEKYAPLTLDELAVRKQKLKDIQQFLRSSAIGPNSGPFKLLVLTGPTGCGKSVAIRLLAQSMDYDIIEWSNNPQISHPGHYDPDYEPTMVKFRHFLKRSIESTSLNSIDSQQHRPKLILLDDLPDLTTLDIKYEFQSILKSYIESNYKFLLVIILSEAQMSTNSNRFKGNSQAETQLTNLSDIISKDIKTSGKYGVIEFNQITRTNLKKVMNRILDQESKYQNVSLNKNQMDDIIEQCHGDIRCAINTLQFYCRPSRPLLPQKRKKPSIPGSSQSSSSSSNIHCRENPLEFYHAIGKILYAKREESGALSSKPSDILNQSNIDCDTLLGWIYTNYPYFTNDITDYSKSMNDLCDGDMLRSMGYWQENAFNQYQLLISMYGIMSSKRNTTPKRLLEFKRPDDRYFRYNLIKLTETASKIKPIVNVKEDQVHKVDSIHNNEMIEDIEAFSEDEFDDVYGDDIDESIFDSLP